MVEAVLDGSVKGIAERKINAALAARKRQFGYTVADIHTRAITAGAAGGSGHKQTVRDACTTELRERFQAGWEILRSVAIDFKLPRSRGAADALKALIKSLVIDSTQDLAQAIALTMGQSGEANGQATVAALVNGVLPEVEADIDLFVSASSVRSEPVAQGRGFSVDQQKVFLSHAAVDASQASLLKEEIERRMPGLNIFCSSYPGDIPLGFRWSAEIQRNLQQATALLLVATSRSIGRPWVWFESGAFWFNRPIVICCLGELRHDNLPPPLGERQAVTLATATDLEILLGSLSTITGVSIADRTGLVGLTEKLAELDRNADTRFDADRGWVGVPWEGKFLVCDGPIEELNLIDPESYQESMKLALEAAGFALVLIRRDQIGEFKDHGRKPVYVTDKRKWRKEVQKGDVILVAQPPISDARH